MDSKSIFFSKTFWGLVLGILAPLAAKYGYTLDADGYSNDIAALLGAALTLYGRFKASQPVHVLPK